MDVDYIIVFVTVALAVTGWIIAHHFTTQRTLADARREVSLEHLVSAYRVLTTEISHRSETSENRKKIESLVSDIQLFGTAEQIALVKTVADHAVSDGVFDLDPLINNLRDDLRQQLKLEPVSDNAKWLRTTKEVKRPSG